MQDVNVASQALKNGKRQLKEGINKILTGFISKFWKFIYMLYSITTMRDTKSKFEVKALKNSIPEIMFLNHSEFIHWFLSNNKLNSENRRVRNEKYETSGTAVTKRVQHKFGKKNESLIRGRKPVIKLSNKNLRGANSFQL